MFSEFSVLLLYQCYCCFFIYHL